MKTRIARSRYLFWMAAIGLLLAGAAAFAQEQSEISVAMWSGPEYDNLVNTAAEFEQATGHTVVIREIAREAYRDVITTRLLAGSPEFDVVYVDSSWVPAYVQAGVLEPLDGFIEARDPDVSPLRLEELEPALDYLRVDGMIYGFPSEGDTVFFFYRTDLLEEAGLDVPQTWDEFLDAAITLTVDETGDGRTDRYGAVIGARTDEASWDFMHYFFGFGCDIIDENYNPIVNNECGVEALEFYAGLRLDHEVVPPDVAAFGYSEILTAFQQDRAAMAIQWMAALPTFSDPDESPLIEGVFEYTETPGRLVDGEVVRGVGGSQWAWLMPLASANKEGAFAFLEWIASKEGATVWALNGGIPSNVAALNDPAVLDQMPQFELLATMFPYRKLFPQTTVSFEMFMAFAEAVNAAVAGTQTAQEALDQAAATMETHLRRGDYIE